MTLRLSIENVDRLPDGGPLRIEVKGRGLDLGRDAHLDWTLPDPEPKHFEQTLRDPLSRRRLLAARRLDQRHLCQRRAVPRSMRPYLLRDGDRLAIGPYIIAVSVEGQQASARSQGFGMTPPTRAGGRRLGRGR